MISLPAPEAHEHVQPHRHEPLGPVRHRRHLDAQELLAERRGHLVGRLERRLDLAEEHRAVDLEVVVVAAVERVEVERALALEVLAIGLDRPLVPRDDVAVAAAQHVDVRRHVLQVPGVGHEPAQLVRRRQRALRKRRHLHRVQVEVQQPGVRLRRARHGPLEHGERLARVGALGRLAGLQVPELPRRAADQRLGEQRRHVGIVSELAGRRPASPRHRRRSRASTPRAASPPGSALPAPRSAHARPGSRRSSSECARSTAARASATISISSSGSNATQSLL